MSAGRILLVEDHPGVAAGLRSALEAAGHEVAVAGSGEAALERVEGEEPHLFVIDVMLPGIDGLELLRRLRDDGRGQPVLVLTALGQEMDKVRGFRAGADGYAVKPIGVLELQAHVAALLRRAAHPGAEADAWTFGDVHVDLRTRTVRRGGQVVDVSPRELDLLVHLLRAEGAAVSRAVLLREVWKYRYPVRTRTVDSHVKLLRAKLEPEPARPRYILTVRKIGYRMDRSGSDA